MAEIPMYHVTDESNVGSIMEQGLQPGDNGELYLAKSRVDARHLGDVYHEITDPVVLEVMVMESTIREGPGDAGDVVEYVKGGPVMPVDITILEE